MVVQHNCTMPKTQDDTMTCDTEQQHRPLNDLDIYYVYLWQI